MVSCYKTKEVIGTVIVASISQLCTLKTYLHIDGSRNAYSHRFEKRFFHCSRPKGTIKRVAARMLSGIGFRYKLIHILHIIIIVA